MKSMYFERGIMVLLTLFLFSGCASKSKNEEEFNDMY